MYRYEAYDRDKPLLDALHLPHRIAGVDAVGGVERFMVLGYTKYGYADVKVEVACAPAQFWRFTVLGAGDGDLRDYRIATGSGALSDYWQFIRRLVDGMIVVESVSEHTR